MKIIPETRRAN